MQVRMVLIALYCAAAAAWPGDGGAAEATGCSIAAHLPGSGGAWDYAVVDEHSGRLFLAQAGVTALDLKTNAITTGLVAGKMTHALATLGDGTLAVDDSQTKVITIFDGASGKILSTIPTTDYNGVRRGHPLDAIGLRPKTGFL